MKYLTQNLFILLCFLIISSFSNAQTPVNYDSVIYAGVDAIFKEHYDEADSLITFFLRQYPENPAGYFYRGVMEWKKSTGIEDFRNYDDTSLEWLDKAVDAADEILDDDEDNVEALFYKGGSYGFKAWIYARQKSYLKTGYNALKGIRNLEKAKKLNTDLYDVYFGTGLYNVTAANFSGIVKFISRFFFIPQGDHEQGMRELRIAHEKGFLARTISLYVLAYSHFYYENDYDEAINKIEKIIDDYPLCVDLQLLLINSYFYRELATPRGEWETIVSLISSFKKDVKNRQLNLSSWYRNKLDFMLGYAYYFLKEYDKAKILLEKYSGTYTKKGESYFAGVSELTLGKIYDLEGLRSKAVEKYRRALKLEEIGNLYEVASYYLRNPFTGETPERTFLGTKTDLPDKP